eukprot:2755688-Pyramimonas_sp.AAC.1
MYAGPAASCSPWLPRRSSGTNTGACWGHRPAPRRCGLPGSFVRPRPASARRGSSWRRWPAGARQARPSTDNPGSRCPNSPPGTTFASRGADVPEGKRGPVQGNR